METARAASRELQGTACKLGGKEAAVPVACVLGRVDRPCLPSLLGPRR